jgi:hypothetical protein
MNIKIALAAVTVATLTCLAQAQQTTARKAIGANALYGQTGSPGRISMPRRWERRPPFCCPACSASWRSVCLLARNPDRSSDFLREG